MASAFKRKLSLDVGGLGLDQPAYKTISGEQLVELLQQGTEELIVVDLRGDDRGGGHIKGSLHIPFSQFEDSLKDFVTEHGQGKKIVMHCMYSQARAPDCAERLLARLADLGSQSQVYVLDGGYHGWVNQWVDDEDDLEALVEGHDPKVWRFADDHMGLVHDIDHPDSFIGGEHQKPVSEAVGSG